MTMERATKQEVEQVLANVVDATTLDETRDCLADLLSILIGSGLFPDEDSEMRADG